MGQTTGITWCNHTFNPFIGCTKVSDGCLNCYAERDNQRFHWVDQWGPQGTRKRTSIENWKKPLQWDRAAKLDGIRRRVFCASLSDVFEDRPELVPWRDDLYDLIEETPNLDWLVLTKRPENILNMVHPMWIWHQKNLWIGTTVEHTGVASRPNNQGRNQPNSKSCSWPRLNNAGRYALWPIAWRVHKGKWEHVYEYNFLNRSRKRTDPAW